VNELLVSPQWLQQRLGEPTVRIVDGSWYLPSQKRDARAEYLAEHIPGAVFFDIDNVSDRSTSLPHMLPTPQSFADAAGALGIGNMHTIVVYDGMGLFSAPRVWWTFHVFGAQDVRVLDGGMPAWKAAGLAVESGAPAVAPSRFAARLNEQAVADLAGVRASLEANTGAVVDVRPAARFRGEAPEPRPGLRSGHMPGARNLPIDKLVQAGGRLAEPDRIRQLFSEAGVNIDGPVVTTCGSGVTAAALVFALATLGKDNVRLYDGSWAEWGGQDDLPVATGPQ
jgi:thiosulfate/3-mercaptopyruvate sulfurtransferase